MKKMLFLLVIIMIAGTGFVYAADDLSASQQVVGGDQGYYDITSTPIGANAALDSTPVGITPTTASVYVTSPPGHTITITKAGYQTWSQYYQGNPSAGQHIPVVAVLNPIPVTLPVTTSIGGDMGYYYINTDQSGATVSFDNQNYGTAPVTVTVSSTGTPGHTISAAKPGYQTWTQFYPGNPQAGQTINVYATLTPVVQTGNIYVTSSPTGASAVLDNGYDQSLLRGHFIPYPPGGIPFRSRLPGTSLIRQISRSLPAVPPMFMHLWLPAPRLVQYPSHRSQRVPAYTWTVSLKACPIS